MKDKRDYRDFLVDIINAIRDIDSFVKGMDFESFISDKEKIYAAVYCLQVIGEAVKNIPDEIEEKYQGIPWRKIAGMRNRLIHGYFAVDPERVWETIKRDLPIGDVRLIYVRPYSSPNSGLCMSARHCLQRMK